MTNIQSDGYTKYLSKEEKDRQDKLFKMLFSDRKLDQNLSIPGGGVLQRNNTNLTAVELCNELDKVARLYATEFIHAVRPEQLEAHRTRNEELKKITDTCFRVTLTRIGLMSLYGDNILSVTGHNKWRKHVWLIASFATLTIALDLFSEQPIEL